MASNKKKLIEDDEELMPQFNPGAGTVGKMPVDISGGKRPMTEYMLVPTHLIDPYGDKRGSDFARHNRTLSEAMVQSIKEVGIIEALTLRPKTGGRYEVLAGESRLAHAIEAGLTEVPARIMNVDDNKARMIFSLSNLLRRDLSFSDKINGWWHYHLSLKEQGKVNELRESVKNGEVTAALGQDGERLDYRQIMRYVKMHDLVPEWIAKLDAGETTLRTAYRIAFFPAEIQTELIDKHVDEQKANELYKLYTGELEGKTWNSDTVAQIIGTAKEGSKERIPTTPQAKAFKKAQKSILKASMAGLREEDYERAEEVVAEALKLYYESR